MGAFSLFRLPLPIPRSTRYARWGIGPEATAGEIRVASARYVDRLQAEGAGPDKVAEANAMKLESAEARAAYDAEHPPLALLRLETPWPGLFEDRAVALAVLRRDVEAFLARRGAAVYHPSDLTRTDFTDDFSHSPLLDGRRRR